MVDEEIRAALDALQSHWDAAEEYIKKVERLRRGLVVTASINELRYAGRRMVEAYTAAKAADVAGNAEKRAEALSLISEARHFCLRAQHDAIDAAVTYIDQALAKFEDEFGPDLLNDRFEHYLSMKVALRQASEVMSASCADRDSREVLYRELKDGLIPTLIDHHYKLETSQVVLEAAFAQRVRLEKRDTGRFLITCALAAVAAIAAVWAIVPHPAQTAHAASVVTQGVPPPAVPPPPPPSALSPSR